MTKLIPATYVLRINHQALDLCESLMMGTRQANSLGGEHAYGMAPDADQPTGSYYAITAALIATLANAIEEANYGQYTHADAVVIARAIYDEAVDNGENIAWQIDLLRSGTITL